MVSMVASWSTSEVVCVASLLAVEVVRGLVIVEEEMISRRVIRWCFALLDVVQ
jgi:hypothetical protein